MPALDALDGGDLATLPEPALRSRAAGGLEPGAIVDALDRAGAAGALLVGEGDADPIAAATLRRATELKLPAWRGARPRAAGPPPSRRPAPPRPPLPGPAGEASGALVVLGAPPATELERLAGDRVAALLALELARDQAGRRPTAARRRAR